MDHLIPYLKAHFDKLEDRMCSFAAHGVIVEGWFKGELLATLDLLVHRRVIERIDREVPYHGRRRIDLFVQSGGPHWIELKHWLVGEQRGTSYGPHFYFSDTRRSGILGDVDKLAELDRSKGRWLLVLLTANPGRSDWQAGLDHFNHKFAPRQLRSLTDPTDFPDSYFLGLLAVLAGAVT